MLFPEPSCIRRRAYLRLLRWRIKLRHLSFFSSSKYHSATHSKKQIPFYKTNEFWGTAGFAVTLTLAGLGFEVNGQVALAKWLLIAAWPFAAVACWCALANARKSPR